MENEMLAVCVEKFEHIEEKQKENEGQIQRMVNMAFSFLIGAFLILGGTVVSLVVYIFLTKP